MQAVVRPTIEALIMSAKELDAAINTIKCDAKFYHINPYTMKDSSGNYVLAPLITAQANVLAAAAYLMR